LPRPLHAHRARPAPPRAMQLAILLVAQRIEGWTWASCTLPAADVEAQHQGCRCAARSLGALVERAARTAARRAPAVVLLRIGVGGPPRPCPRAACAARRRWARPLAVGRGDHPRLVLQLPGSGPCRKMRQDSAAGRWPAPAIRPKALKTTTRCSLPAFFRSAPDRDLLEGWPRRPPRPTPSRSTESMPSTPRSGRVAVQLHQPGPARGKRPKVESPWRETSTSYQRSAASSRWASALLAGADLLRRGPRSVTSGWARSASHSSLSCGLLGEQDRFGRCREQEGE